MAEATRKNIEYEIVEKIGVLQTYPTGWNKEINLVAWNGNPAKYDIRDWAPGHVKMSKGVTMHSGEMKIMLSLLEGREI